ncbi:MAG: TerB family tellurite resistance protein, partial [Paracoccus sp. (in: a-proteobacteria)]
MFRNLLTRLFTEDQDARRIDTGDAEVALAALLVRVARADDRYDPIEQQHIEQILARRDGLTAQQAAERRAAAEMIEAEAPDTVRFTRTIKDR